MRPLLRPVASSSWSWPNLKRCHSMLTQRLCFSGTDEPNASPHTMSPQSMVCSRGSPAGTTCPPSLFRRDRFRGLDASVPSPAWPWELQRQKKVNRWGLGVCPLRGEPVHSAQLRAQRRWQTGSAAVNPRPYSNNWREAQSESVFAGLSLG